MNFSSKKVQPYLFLTLIFIISRVLFYIIGIRFDIDPIFWFHQILDLNLLRSSLSESIFYLHSQPPLFNLYIGLVLKIFPLFYSAFFNFTYLLLGLICTFGLYFLSEKLTGKKISSFLITSLYISTPPVILYENWLFYSYPVTVLLLLSAVLFAKFEERGNFIYGFIFFSILAAIVLLRSLFHPLWFLLIIILMVIYYRKYWKVILLSSALPLIIVLALVIKNEVLFGTMTSSWFGMNFAHITISNLPFDRIDSLISQKNFSKIAGIKPFSHPADYRQFVKNPKYWNVPCLDDTFQNYGRGVNYNNSIYIEVSKMYLKDDLAAIKNEPLNYLNGVCAASYLFFREPNDVTIFFDKNKEKIPGYYRLYNHFIYGQLSSYNILPDYKKYELKKEGFNIELFKYTGIFSAIIFIIVFIYTIIFLFKNSKLKPPNYATIFYILLNIIYVFIVSNLFEVGENNRFRFNIEPLILVLFIWLLSQKKSVTPENTESRSG